MPATTYRMKPARGSGEWHADDMEPAVLLGVGLGVGMLIGALAARRFTRSAAAGAGGDTSYRPLRERSARAAQIASSWDHITDALLGVAIAKGVEAIGGYVPGFKEQYERRHVQPG